MPRDWTSVMKTSLLLALMLTVYMPPFVVQPTAALGVSESPKIAATLAAEMPAQKGEPAHPVFVQFEDGTDPQTMLEAVTKSISTGFIIRHVFNLIPVVSLWATDEAIREMANCLSVRTLGLDQKRYALELEMPSVNIHVSSSASYEGPEDILNANDLWSQGYNGTGIKVAVIDTGVQSAHIDFQHCLVGFRDFINGLNDMDPSNGITAYDDNGHGTACAWLIAGSGEGNGGEFKGIAPGATLLIEKALESDGTGDDSVIAQAIEYAVNHEVAIISLSLGGTWQDSVIEEPSVLALRAAVASGVVAVVAAGNDGPAPLSVDSPGITEEVITVGASVGNQTVVAFSSRGPVERTITTPVGLSAKPDIVAPGYLIVSGRANSASGAEFPYYNYSQYGANYAVWSGTSASTPQIAGLVALLMNKHVGLTPIEVKAFLMAGATDLGDDPMAQGYGLANVSKSSELYQTSLGIISILSPNKYPTLPGGDHAYIVGEERDEQVVSVISTVSQGQLTIVTTGNASTFVNRTVDSLTVSSGYSHFGINLNIPQGLPLSAVGHYSGNLSLVSGNTTIASMKLDMWITTYGGRMLVDMTHQSLTDADSPAEFRYFTQYLREQGIELSEFGSPASSTLIDSSALSSAESFMIMDTEIEYTSQEIAALHAFVDNGGTLLILSEFYNSTTNTASFAFDSYNDILAPYGIQCEPVGIGVGPDSTGAVYGVDHGGAVNSSEITDGVKNLYILFGSTFAVEPSVSGAQGLFWVDAERNHAIVATATHGRGNVIAVSDGSTLYDNVLYEAIQEGADNLKLIENIATAVEPQLPRIFDVVFRYHRIGEMANVTTYVFDEDLANVTITITRPNGTEITPSVAESLGYRFDTSFALTSGGYYGIVVAATDMNGNSRIYQFLELIPVDVVEDLFIQIVIYVMLGIVLAGLVYVGVLKLGLGRRASNKREKGWEVPMEGGESPPSIQ